MMSGSGMPKGMILSTPMNHSGTRIDWSNGALFAFTHDPYLIHFVHRWWAWAVVVALVVFARRVKPLDRRASRAIHTAFGTQILLGIATVMSGIALPFAVAHQAVGAILAGVTTWGAHALGANQSRSG